MAKVENKKEKARQERQEVFASKFDEDIKAYKESGQIMSELT